MKAGHRGLVLAVMAGAAAGYGAPADCWLQRPFDGDPHERAADAGALAACPKVLFIKRDFDARPYGHATVPVFDNRKFGCQICLFDPARPAEPPAVLFSREDGQIFDMSLSFDARHVLFAYRERNVRENYHIFEMAVDGSGLRQVTTGAYMDVSAQYLPGGRIVFASSRSRAYALCQPHEVTGLFTTDRDGGDLRRIGYGALSETSPTVLDDGRVLYTRWEYVDKDVCLQQGLWSVNPDGTRVALHYGNTITVPPVMWQARQVPGTRQVIATLCAHHGYSVGALGLVDQRRGLENPASLRCITPDEPIHPTNRSFAYPEVATVCDAQRTWAYRDPWPIDAHRFLCAYGGPPKGGPQRYRLFLLNDCGEKTLLYGDRRVDCLNPIPLVPRPEPPDLAGATPTTDDAAGTFFVQDVYAGPLAALPRGTIREIRVMSQVQKSCNRLDPRAYAHGPVISMGSTYFVKTCFGSAPVSPEGYAYFKAPAGVNLYFQALDGEGKEVLRMGTETQIMPGERQGCVGCHEDRFQTPYRALSREGEEVLRRGPVALSPPPCGESGPVDFVKHVQPVFDRYCASCHSGAAPGGGLDLSSDKTIYFNMAYADLVAREGSRFCQRDAPTNGLVWWTDGNWGGQTGNYQPYQSGSHRSRLCAYLENGHGGVTVDENSRRRVYAWIDAHVPYYATYDCTRPGAPGARFGWPGESFRAFVKVFNDNCSACHGNAASFASGLDHPNPIKEAWINLSHPERSRVLNAHLEKAAGGWGVTGERNGRKAPLLKDAGDPVYQAMLKEIRVAAAELAAKPRVDMPGAAPAPFEPRYNHRYAGAAAPALE